MSGSNSSDNSLQINSSLNNNKKTNSLNSQSNNNSLSPVRRSNSNESTSSASSYHSFESESESSSLELYKNNSMDDESESESNENQFLIPNNRRIPGNNGGSGGQPQVYMSNGNNGSNRGYAVQIAKICERKFVLNDSELSKILLMDKIRNKPVVVVSIAGDLRKGKSFMLNFFLRYLQSDCGRAKDWIGKNTNQPLDGFSWRGGSERDTIGIMMWSEPFIVKRADGEEVAVLLMDTQGAFDSEDTVKDSAIIFALSLLTSSIFIYNLHHNIQENNLDNLHVFSDYGLLAIPGEKENGKPFQKLVFLIRDWSSPAEYPYGKSGGDAKLDKYLIQQKTERNRRVRDFIEQSFQQRTCFLMPYPGKLVATSPEFRGNIADIEPEFVQHLEDFVPLMISKRNLITKKIGGSEVDGHKLFVYFTVYAKKFSGDELPEPKCLLEATAEANNLIAVSTALDHYSQSMENICGGDIPFLSSKVLLKSHQKIKTEALEIFNRTPKMGGKEFSESHRLFLITKLDEKFLHFSAQNESKDFLRHFRPPLYVLIACLVTFFLYYLFSAAGMVVISHIFFILSTIFLGLFLTYLIHIRDGLSINTIESIVVSLSMSAFALFLLYWKRIFSFFRLSLEKRFERH